MAFLTACNMLACSLLPGARSRETISGYVGRNAMAGRWWARVAATEIDKWWRHTEKDHCRNTARQEMAARRVLGKF